MTERPVCACHGESQYWSNDTRYTAGGFWRCSVKKRAYNHAKVGQAARERYEAKRLRVHVAGEFHSYRIPPGQKTELTERLAQFRAERATERREALDGGFDPAVPRA